VRVRESLRALRAWGLRCSILRDLLVRWNQLGLWDLADLPRPACLRYPAHPALQERPEDREDLRRPAGLVDLVNLEARANLLGLVHPAFPGDLEDRRRQGLLEIPSILEGLAHREYLGVQLDLAARRRPK
jgi:hypothetical protein